MKIVSMASALYSWSAWRLRSVPVFFKILGIGALVALLFGGVIILETGSSLSRALYHGLQESTLATVRSLVIDLERPMITGNFFSVTGKLQAALGIAPHMRYIIARDPDGRIVAHTFDGEVPTDLRTVFSESHWGATQVLTSREGLILDVALPILNGRGGSVQLGVSDRMIARELSGYTKSVLKSLALCVSVGAVLALGLTHILTEPIHHLMQAADRIGKGDFGSKARVFSADEVGRLAVAFNQMADGLGKYRQEVRNKEEARLALIERIIQAQEEERKSISRELHDGLGQNLLALLLMVRACDEDGGSNQAAFGEVGDKIGEFIDEIHRLVRGMRPPILDDYGLDFALARLTAEVSSYSSVSIGYQFISAPELGRMPNRIEVTLYRIVQEAISNVVRHAGAERASVVVLRKREEAVLLVEDYGCGFDPGSLYVKDSSHLGLTGMRERTALLGGTCAFESEPGKGTTVKVVIPFKGTESCPSAS